MFAAIIGAMLLRPGFPPIEPGCLAAAGEAGLGGVRFPDLVLTQVPVNSADASKRNGANHDPIITGSRVVALIRDEDEWRVRNLTEGFETAVLGDVSYGAHHLLVVGRRLADEPMSLWEVELRSGVGRRLIGAPFDCQSAIYLSSLFTIDDDAPQDRIAFIAGKDDAQTIALYSARRDGTDVRRLSFAPGDVSDPVILPDGRLLFVQHRPAGASGDAPTSVLMTVFPDGTDLFPFAALHEPPALRGAARSLADGHVVYAERTGPAMPSGAPFGGALVSVRTVRSLSTRSALTAADAGAFRDVVLFPDGRLASSYRPASVPNATFALVLLDRESGTVQGEFFDDPQWHEINAHIVAVRPRPAGRSSVVNYEKSTGEFYCLDAYRTDRNSLHSERAIRRVRVIALQETDSRRETLLGEARVERDGSFFVTLPAQRPVRFETIGEQGDTVRRMNSWVWVMPGERRGCIGCHEDRALTPPNRHVQALRRAPESLTGLLEVQRRQSEGSSEADEP